MRKLPTIGLYLLICAFVLVPWTPAIAHSCCYSSTVWTSTYPACYNCFCTYMQDKVREWKEYVPVSQGNPHEHEWITGSYLISTTGPHRYGNCEGP